VGGNEVDLQGNSAALSRRDCAGRSMFIRVANRLLIVDARIQVAAWQRLSNAFTRERMQSFHRQMSVQQRERCEKNRIEAEQLAAWGTADKMRSPFVLARQRDRQT
jgi:hypothetical protein